MLHIAWPWMALLLPLPWIHYRMRRAAEPVGPSVFFPFASSLTIPRTDSVRVSGIARWILIAIWLLLVLAAMRPQWLGDPMPAPTSGRRLWLAIDVSGSMATEDMAGGMNRLQVVQRVAGRFIERRRGDQVGLILFGSQPYLQAPLTTDLSTVHRFLDQAVVGVAGPQTTIGDAIGLAIKRLRAAGVDDKAHDVARTTVLVLLTDGQDDAGLMQPIQAARLAEQERLRIYTIGVGSPAGSGFFDTGDSDLDEDTLRSIASATGGRYYRATDESSLDGIYEQINKLEPVAGRERWLRPEDEWFTWPLGLALLLSLPTVLRFKHAWN